MSTLSLQNVNKIYPNGVQAVFDFNLEIKDKEFVVFVGPSGCGKSTTLRMIAGFEKISSGRLYIDKTFVNNVEPKDRNIAMVFQNYALYPHMTVYENLAFALELRKIKCPIFETSENTEACLLKEKEIRKRIKECKKKYAKDQNSQTLLQEYISLYDELYAAHDLTMQTLKQKVGIDYEEIKELNNDTVALQKQIKDINKKINKYKNDSQFSQAAFDLLDQKKEQISENEKRIKYLEENEVPLTKKRHLTKDEMDLKINKTAGTIDLIKYLYRLPGALSGGQRQRVALGRAIVREPKVFLMDEPLSNLDAKLRVQTRGEITKIHKKVGATTIYVTHDQTEAMTMADRIVVMKDGYIQQIGTPEEIYNNPANQFVASFIGNPAMNFIKAHVKDGEAFTRDGNVNLKIDSKQKELLKNYNNQDIVVGVRPEKLGINEKKDASLKTVFDYDELLGYEQVIYSTLDGQSLMSKCAAGLVLKDNQELEISYNFADLYFFDESGKRIGE